MGFTTLARVSVHIPLFIQCLCFLFVIDMNKQQLSLVWIFVVLSLLEWKLNYKN